MAFGEWTFPDMKDMLQLATRKASSQDGGTQPDCCAYRLQVAMGCLMLKVSSGWVTWTGSCGE
eukprot:1798554-Amphidinium_carterae.1